MKKTIPMIPFAVVAAFLLLPSVIAGQASEEVLANADIIALTEAWLPAQVILDKIGVTRTDFETTVEALVALAQAGVDPSVISAMTKAASTGEAAGAEAPRPVGGQRPFAGASGGGRGEPPQGGFDSPAAAGGSRRPGETFRDTLRSGGSGPEMVVIPAGSFRMGCVSGVKCDDDEKPVHNVTIARPFAVSKYELTFEEYDRFTMPTGRVDDQGWGRGRRPVINVSWQDAQDYVRWLSGETGATYRLLTEAEWEYAARAGTSTAYNWGNQIGSGRANCQGCGSQWDKRQTAPVGSFGANGFGLHDMHGNVWEWVADCWNGSYNGAPSDGSAWTSGDCSDRVLRGGSLYFIPRNLRSAYRLGGPSGYRDLNIGFRVARTLTP